MKDYPPSQSPGFFNLEKIQKQIETAARGGINGQPAGDGQIEKVAPARFSATETMDIDMDLGAQVSEAYHAQAPFAFNGKIDKVVVELQPVPASQRGEVEGMQRKAALGRAMD